MRNVGRSSSLFVFAALSLAGCPSDPGVPANVPLADLPGVLAPAICAAYETCNPLVGAVYGTGTVCADTLSARFSDAELGALEDSIAAGNITYHGDLVADCVAAIQAIGCELSDPLEVCEDMFEGLVADGGACERNEECGEASYCAITTSCPGTCQARVATGAACTSSSACQSGLSCDSGTCRAPAGPGAACNGTTGVACSNLGLVCVGDDGATPGECTRWSEVLMGAEGELCDALNEDYCDDGLSCAFDGLDGTTPRFRCVTRVAAGAACTIALPDICPPDQFCSGLDFMMGDTEGTCAPLPTAGDPCTPALPFPRCAPGLVCTGGNMCEPLGRVGATCASDATCASSYCEGGRCVDGEPLACRAP